MTGPALPGRLRDAGLSAWELGDLLGIHPHLVSGPHPPLTGRPVQALIEIARRLDIHPADLVPELDPLLACHRQPPGDTGHGRRADALTVLTALATARAPLTAGQLAPQRRALRDATGAAVLDEDQAHVLLAALAAGQSDTYSGLRAQPGWAGAETALKETGLIYSSNAPDHVHISDDVKFSLRYSDDSDLARELGEPPAPGGASPW